MKYLSFYFPQLKFTIMKDQEAANLRTWNHQQLPIHFLSTSFGLSTNRCGSIPHVRTVISMFLLCSLFSEPFSSCVHEQITTGPTEKLPAFEHIAGIPKRGDQSADGARLHQHYLPAVMQERQLTMCGCGQERETHDKSCLPGSPPAH